MKSKGFLQIQNWKPINLDSISSITQCKLNSFTSLASSTSPDQMTNKDNDSNRSRTPDTDSNNNFCMKTLENMEKIISDKKKFINESVNNGDTINNETLEMRKRYSLCSENDEETNSSCSSAGNELNTSDSPSRRSSLSNDDQNDYYNHQLHNVNNNDTDCNNNEFSKQKNSKNEPENSDSVTVNDILSHVISFATLNIKLSFKYVFSNC